MWVFVETSVWLKHLQQRSTTACRIAGLVMQLLPAWSSQRRVSCWVRRRADAIDMFASTVLGKLWILRTLRSPIMKLLNDFDLDKNNNAWFYDSMR